MKFFKKYWFFALWAFVTSVTLKTGDMPLNSISDWVEFIFVSGLLSICFWYIIQGIPGFFKHLKEI